MERLKKNILQAVTTGITACTGTTGTCYVIIPDLTAVYHMKIGLKQDTQDIGFFDAYVPIPEPGPIPPSLDVPDVETGTGISKIRIAEITVNDNELISSGNSTITEYGTVYTSSVTNNTDSTLIIGNTDVDKESTSGSLIDNEKYSNILADLIVQRKYYYRAFAINGVGTAYGAIKNIDTGGFPPLVPKIQVDLCWNDTTHDDPDDGMGGSVRLYECGTSIQNIYIPEPSTSHTICFTNIVSGHEYDICLSSISAVINNNPASAQKCWYDWGSSSPNYSLCIPDAESGCRYCVLVKCGIPV